MKRIAPFLYCFLFCIIACEKAPEEIGVSSITLSQTMAEMLIGETVQLTATILPSNATDKAVTWASSKQSVATISNNGLITAVAEGQSTITATAGGKSATCQVTVSSGFVAVVSISLDKESITLEEDGSTTLVATIKPDDATDKSVAWSSSNTSIATVDQSGKVTAVKEGSATITARASDKQATCSVTVKKKVIAVTSVTLNKTELSLNKGQSETLTANVKPDNATDKSVTWSSSNTGIATVDSNGKVTAVFGGNATITAKAGDQQATCTVTVSVPLESVSLNKNELALNKGQSETLTATVKPDDATEKTITWSSSNTGVATVDSNGKVTAVGGGNATITAKAGDRQATCAVTVTVPVESITLDKTSVALEEGESVTLSVTITPEDATDKSITWTTSANSIATVDQNGKVTAIQEGTATVTAKAGGKEASCEITVNKKVIQVTSITLDKEELTVFVGNQVTLTATVKPDDATDKTVTWTSSNTSAATVDNGVIKGVGTGRTTITATAGNQSATCSVLVVKDSYDGVYAQYYGGSIVSINGRIQSGSQLNFGVVNYSSETIRVVSVQLIDGQTGNGGNVMSIGKDIASGSSTAWTITINGASIYEPKARFVYTFKGKTYTCEAQYTAPNWGF